MNFYFDTEFTGLQKNTDLISIGIISDRGSFFYAEFTDYDRSKCDNWIQENVINNLLLDDVSKISESSDYHMIVKGTKSEVSEMLIKWLKVQSPDDTWQFVSDVSHYDFVLLIDLISNGGTAFNCPREFSPVCIDLNTILSQYFNTTERNVFDANRERVYTNLLKKHHPELFEEFEHMGEVEVRKHNALFDAVVIREINKMIGFGFGDVCIIPRKFNRMMELIEILKNK